MRSVQQAMHANCTQTDRTLGLHSPHRDIAPELSQMDADLPVLMPLRNPTHADHLCLNLLVFLCIGAIAGFSFAVLLTNLSDHLPNDTR